MRLCLVANPNSVHVQRWARYFAERGHEVHVINARPAPVAAALLPGVRLHQARVPRVPLLRNVALGLVTRRMVQAIRPDVLHAHQVSPDGWLAAMAGYHPLLVTAWGSDLLLGPRVGARFNALIRWALRRADYVTCVSAGLAEAARALGADPARVEVAPWGIDATTFRPAGPDPALRAEMGLPPGPVVLSIRAMRPVYNPLDIVHAIPAVLNRVPDAQFVVRTYAEQPPLLEQLRTDVRELSVAGAVHTVGELPGDEAIARLYRLADVAVSVPSSDGMPQSVLEAMGCGAVPVLTDLPSLREWIADGREGLFVPVNDPPALAAAITRLLTDDPLRGEMRARGQALIQARGDRRVWMARAETLYERLSGKARA